MAKDDNNLFNTVLKFMIDKMEVLSLPSTSLLIPYLIKAEEFMEPGFE